MARHRRTARRGFGGMGILKPALAAVGGFFIGPIVKKMAPQIPFVDLGAGAALGFMADGKRGAVIGAGGALGGSMMGGGAGGSNIPLNG